MTPDEEKRMNTIERRAKLWNVRRYGDVSGIDGDDILWLIKINSELELALLLTETNVDCPDGYCTENYTCPICELREDMANSPEQVEGDKE